MLDTYPKCSSGKQPCPELRPPSSYERIKVSRFLPNLNQAFQQGLHETTYGYWTFPTHHQSNIIFSPKPHNSMGVMCIRSFARLGAAPIPAGPPRVFCPRSAPLAEKAPHRTGWPGVAWSHPRPNLVDLGKAQMNLEKAPWSDFIAIFVVKIKQRITKDVFRWHVLQPELKSCGPSSDTIAIGLGPSAIVTARPVRPARAVLPTRWM